MARFDPEQTAERFRKTRHRPQGRRSVRELRLEDALPDGPRFDDPSLQSLHEQGHFDELLWQLKSGKEATVYVVDGPKGLLAAKIYSDMAVRSFKNDAAYRDGRFIGDARIEKAIEQRSRTGVNAQQALWIEEEYRQLCALHAAGVAVPRPVAREGRVILMEFIGDEDGPAPRLSDVRLSREEAESALEQATEAMAAMLRVGRVHGDYSTFNLLWQRGRVVVIDFPQVVEVEVNRQAAEILARDARSLAHSFGRFGLRVDPERLLRDVRRRARNA
ncbi:RIO kinase 1 [Deinobacterium chartae]|uniref:non-specific serine/threonine protein kinase n=1 Tax=Deinobacterium chartae TaxID=521158 RepID=A0A841I181_9DEIO|nr:RIO1 family regulatory kinase/ATPase [Deinobacterium chartae]MBB6097832.1 RIO kinase 1 [Deinobacterium chartae]